MKLAVCLCVLTVVAALVQAAGPGEVKAYSREAVAKAATPRRL